jgi:hypothetical protein
VPPRESEARWLFSLGSLVLSRRELTGSRLPRSSFFLFFSSLLFPLSMLTIMPCAIRKQDSGGNCCDDIKIHIQSGKKIKHSQRLDQ